MRTLLQIKTDIDNRIAQAASRQLLLPEALQIIKLALEDVITSNGSKGKSSLIRSQQLVNLLHEAIKASLIKSGVNPSNIKPLMGCAGPEVKLAGFLKFKKQDVCVFPSNLKPRKESLDFDGLYTTGEADRYGELFTEHILSINLRTQLSSLSKNIDTMFERTYAEPLNIHRRVPKMVLGEVYLISVNELDSGKFDLNTPSYRKFTTKTAVLIEKYIKGFAALNLRKSQGDDGFKYERVALIIADFFQDPIKIYNTTQDLIDQNLLPIGSTASLDNLDFDNFIQTLLDVHEKRFGVGILS